MATNRWDVSKLPSISPCDDVLRAIDDDDIAGWLPSENRWDIKKSAMESDHLEPGDESEYGWSVLVAQRLVSHCGAPAGAEVTWLQAHVVSHTPCPPDWTQGIIVKASVADLARFSLGFSHSPSSACSVLTDAHGSAWKASGWTRKDRAEALKFLGQKYVFESPKRESERTGVATTSSPSIRSPVSSPNSGNP